MVRFIRTETKKTNDFFEYTMNKRVSIRFYEELNDYLSPKQRKQEIEVAFKDTLLIKDCIESLGAPHTEVDLILVNSQSVPFSYALRDGDRISVYPVFEAFDISTVTRLRETPLRIPKFVLDTNLQGLAKMLRIFGFDTVVINEAKPQDIVDLSVTQNRTILTRSKALLLRNGVVRGYRVKHTQPPKQFSEIIRHFNLEKRMDPFSRCVACNNSLVKQSSAGVTSSENQNPMFGSGQSFVCMDCQNAY
jgi:uncharacterized protein with PIN domain